MTELSFKRRVISAIDFTANEIEVDIKLKKEIKKFFKKLRNKYDCIVDSDVHTTTRRGDRKLDLRRVKMRFEQKPSSYL